MAQKTPILGRDLIFLFLTGGLAAVFLLQIILPQSFLSWLALSLAIILMAFFFSDPGKGFLLLLIIRPAIDRFSDTISINLTDNLSFNASAGFGILTCFLLAVFILKNLKHLTVLPLKKWWGLFLLICAISIFFSVSVQASVYEIIRIFSVLLVFISAFIFTRQDKKNYLGISWAIVASCIFPFLLASYQLVTKTGLGGTDGFDSRLFGTFSQPNPFASFVFIVLSVLLFLFFFSRKKYSKLLVFLIAWAGFLLVGTYSRGAWLAFLIFLFILSFFKSPKSILVIISTCVILFISSQSIQNRVQDVYNPPADSSVRWRFQQWGRVYDEYIERPLTGYGIGTETIVHDLEYGPYSGNPYTHNDFLRVAVETGIFGAIAYFILIFSTLKLLYINFRKEPSGVNKDFQLVVLALFLAMVSFSLTNNTLRETVTQWLTWSLIGTSLAMSQAKTLTRHKKST